MSSIKYLFEKVGKLETSIATEIKVIAEVEKISILYDLDNNGSLDFYELSEYLKDVTEPVINLSESDIKEIFYSMDADKNGTLQRPELTDFIRIIMYRRTDI